MGAFRRRGATTNSWTAMENTRASIACRPRTISTQNRRSIHEERTASAAAGYDQTAHASTRGELAYLLERSAPAGGLCSLAYSRLYCPARPIQQRTGHAR